MVGLAGEVEMAAALASLAAVCAPGDSGANEKDGSNSDCFLGVVSHLLLLLLLVVVLLPTNCEVGRFKLKVENAAPPAAAVPATGPCHEGRLEGSKVSSGVGQSLLLMTPALLLPALMRLDRAEEVLLLLLLLLLLLGAAAIFPLLLLFLWISSLPFVAYKGWRALVMAKDSNV